MTSKIRKIRKRGPATLAIHGRERRPKAHHAVSTPICQTSNYSFDSMAEVVEFMKAKAQGRIIREQEYGRYCNPTQQEAERKLAAIEGAERAILFSTGMSAVILTLMAYMKKDGHIIFTSDCYRQTRDFATNFLTKFGLQNTLVPPTTEAIENAIRPNTNIIFTESPTNPYLRVLDLPAVVKVAKRRRVLTMIDATLATPLQHPAARIRRGHRHPFGHEISGRPQRPAGGRDAGRPSIARRPEQTAAHDWRDAGPLTCFLLERGLKTFPLRMEHHNRAGLQVAQALEKHPKVEKVWYPGLKSHPDYAIAKQQMRGFGSVITFSGERRRESDAQVH